MIYTLKRLKLSVAVHLSSAEILILDVAMATTKFQVGLAKNKLFKHDSYFPIF